MCGSNYQLQVSIIRVLSYENILEVCRTVACNVSIIYRIKLRGIQYLMDALQQDLTAACLHTHQPATFTFIIRSLLVLICKQTSFIKLLQFLCPLLPKEWILKFDLLKCFEHLSDSSALYCATQSIILVHQRQRKIDIIL